MCIWSSQMSPKRVQTSRIWTIRIGSRFQPMLWCNRGPSMLLSVKFFVLFLSLFLQKWNYECVHMCMCINTNKCIYVYVDGEKQTLQIVREPQCKSVCEISVCFALFLTIHSRHCWCSPVPSLFLSFCLLVFLFYMGTKRSNSKIYMCLYAN